MNRAKQKGTWWESDIVRALTTYWPHVERRALSGVNDKGDIAGIPGVVVEAKNEVKLQFGPWLKEAHIERDRAKAAVGVVWAKRKGKGTSEDGFVVMDGHTFMQLLRDAGY